MVSVTAITGELSKLRAQLVEAVATIRTLATTDELTLLANRRHMHDLLAVAAAAPRRLPAARVRRADRRRFLQGHQRQVRPCRRRRRAARRLPSEAGATLRSADTLARWGGEEFLLLMPDTKLDEALAVIGRMAARIGAMRVGARRSGAEDHLLGRRGRLAAARALRRSDPARRRSDVPRQGQRAQLRAGGVNGAPPARYNEAPASAGNRLRAGRRRVNLGVSLLRAPASRCWPAPARRRAERVQILVEDAASPWSNRARRRLRQRPGARRIRRRRRRRRTGGGAVRALQGAGDAGRRGRLFQHVGRAGTGQAWCASPTSRCSASRRASTTTCRPGRARSVAELDAAACASGIVHGYEYPPFVAQLARARHRARQRAFGCRQPAQAGRRPHRRRAGDDRRNAQRGADRAPGRRAQHRLRLPEHADGIVHRFQHHPPGRRCAAAPASMPASRSITGNGTRQAIQAKWKLRCARICPE